MPRVDLAALDDDALARRGRFLELAHCFRRQLLGEEGDLLALRIGRDLAERVPLHDPRKVGGGTDDHRDLQAEALLDQPLYRLGAHPLAEDDEEGLIAFSQAAGPRLQIVGDVVLASLPQIERRLAKDK